MRLEDFISELNGRIDDLSDEERSLQVFVKLEDGQLVPPRCADFEYDEKRVIVDLGL